MAEDYSHLTEDDVVEILRHKPDPEKKLAPELAKDHKVSPRSIRGIWDRGGLPTGGAAALRKRKIDTDTMMKIISLKGQKSAVEVADEFLVVTRIVKQIWSQME